VGFEVGFAVARAEAVGAADGSPVGAAGERLVPVGSAVGAGLGVGAELGVHAGVGGAVGARTSAGDASVPNAAPASANRTMSMPIPCGPSGRETSGCMDTTRFIVTLGAMLRNGRSTRNPVQADRLSAAAVRLTHKGTCGTTAATGSTGRCIRTLGRVRVARGEKGALKMKRILLAYDGGEPARRALGTAIDLAKKYEARVDVVSVVPFHPGRAPVDPWDDHVVHADELRDAKAILEEHGLHPELLEPVGDPASTIERIANDGAYDTVVVGSRGLSALSRFLQGSVSTHVAGHAHTTVVVVR
jgi:nucleotide-binding universal stress UspA family protein